MLIKKITEKEGRRMNFDWSVNHYNYQDRIGNLQTRASGIVKSDKFFPIFLTKDGSKKVFKPLSKTKPLSTPYFAYSEVFWSTVIHDYFDSQTPIYRLATCKDIETEYPNKYHHGTEVDLLEKSDQKIVNLYEVFEKHPEENVNIKDYINFCEKFYDYQTILNSEWLQENPNLQNQLAYQVLLSILRLDQNFHYENVLWWEKDDQITSIVPTLDHEFSTMFLYLDQLKINKERLNRGLSSLCAPKEKEGDIFAPFYYQAFAVLAKNLDWITTNCPDISILFLENLKKWLHDLKREPFQLENQGYLTPFNSENFVIGQALYKQNNPELAIRLKEKIPQYNPELRMINQVVYEEVLLASETLKTEIEKRLIKLP